MIQLYGHKVMFVASSGALGFDGDDGGHGLVKLWKKPARWLGRLNPKNYLTITKTVTQHPLVGNLKWWCPWRCVRRWGDEGFINAVGLTNPGIDEWFRLYYPRTVKKGYKIALSIAPKDVGESVRMAAMTRPANLVALHINPICPNVDHTDQTVDHYLNIIQAASYSTPKPIIVKLGWRDPYMEIIGKASQYVEAWDLINATPIGQHPGLHESFSPLQKYGLTGAISGPQIAFAACEVLREVKEEYGASVKVISGGGIYTYEEMKKRVRFGADALSIGTLFLKDPSEPDRLVARFCEEYGLPLE